MDKGDIVINSGSLKLAKCTTATSAIQDFTINGGSVEIDKIQLSSYSSLVRNLKVTGGSLKVKSSSSGGIHASNSVDISGGEVMIETDGIHSPIMFNGASVDNNSSSKRYFSISGGTLNINTKQYGIKIEDANAESYIEFAGGGEPLLLIMPIKLPIP